MKKVFGLTKITYFLPFATISYFFKYISLAHSYGRYMSCFSSNILVVWSLTLRPCFHLDCIIEYSIRCWPKPNFSPIIFQFPSSFYQMNIFLGNLCFLLCQTFQTQDYWFQFVGKQGRCYVSTGLKFLALSDTELWRSD